jgi:hypothetical protein
MGFPRRRHPLNNTDATFRDLVAGFNRFAGKLSRLGSDADALVKPLAKGIGSIEWAIDREMKLSSIYGPVRWRGIDNIVDCFGRFSSDLGSTDRRLAKGLTGDLRDRTRRLGKAIMAIQEAARSRRVESIHEHGYHREQFLKVKEAMAKFDKESAEALTGWEVESWCEWTGGIGNQPRAEFLRDPGSDAPVGSLPGTQSNRGLVVKSSE